MTTNANSSTDIQSSTLVTTSETSSIFSTSRSSTMANQSSTPNVSLNDDTMAFLVGAFFAMTTVSIVVCFAVWYLKFRSRLNKPQVLINNQRKRSLKTVNNITYENEIPSSGKVDLQPDSVRYKNTCGSHTYENRSRVLNDDTNGVYEEKGEGDYDHLRAIRQKQIAPAVEENSYGTADHWEDFYSALELHKNPDPDLNNENYDTDIYADTCNSSVSLDNSEYDHCNMSDLRKLQW